MKTTSNDTLYNGRLVIKQPYSGYRFSADAPLLTWFVCGGRRAQHCVDLGTGSGVVGLGLLMSAHVTHVTGIEIQSELAAMATDNSILNNFSSRFDVIEGDIRDQGNSIGPGSVDLIVANPPFWPVTKGRLPKSDQRKIACHELMGTIGEWCKVTARLLEPRHGRFCIVFPARRLDALVISLAENNLSARSLCLVHSYAEKPAELALVSARPGTTSQLQISPPLYLKTSDGNDSEIATRIFNGEFSDTIKSHRDNRQP